LTRYIDKTVATVAAVVLVVLMGFQSYAVLDRRSAIKEALGKAKKLAEDVDANELLDMPRDPAVYSGAIFKRWEELPFAQSLDAWDFYANQPLPSR